MCADPTSAKQAYHSTRFGVYTDVARMFASPRGEWISFLHDYSLVRPLHPHIEKPPPCLQGRGLLLY